MNREYKIRFMLSPYPWGGIFGVFFAVLSLYALVNSYNKIPFVLMCVMTTLPVVSIFIAYLCLFYFNKLKVSIDDENVTYKMPDKIVTLKIADIYKIEKDFSYAGVGYYVFFHDSRNKKRHIKFTQYLDDVEELIGYLQKKADIKIRWEGTVNVENEKRPIIKVLKILWNIFITIFLFSVFVAYPFISHYNRDKERRQNLPIHSLWP